MASNTGQEMQAALSWASQPPVALRGSSLVLSITARHPMDLLQDPARLCRGTLGLLLWDHQRSEPDTRNLQQKGAQNQLQHPRNGAREIPQPQVPRSDPAPWLSLPSRQHPLP